MKLLNKSNRTIAVQDPILERGVTVLKGDVGEFSDVAGADLLASFPSDWEAADVKPTKKLKKES